MSRKQKQQNRQGKRRNLDQRLDHFGSIISNGRLFLQLMADNRVPSYIRFGIPALAAIYVVSPIDLIPDFIPILGEFDDLAIAATAVALVIKLAPEEVVNEYRHGGKVHVINPEEQNNRFSIPTGDLDLSLVKKWVKIGVEKALTSFMESQDMNGIGSTNPEVRNSKPNRSSSPSERKSATRNGPVDVSYRTYYKH